MYHPSRGGVRGGTDQFSWDSVKTDKHRENYLGHSLMAPVGRWQKGKDLSWYAKERKGDEGSKKLAVDQRMAIKKAEEEAMMVALGFKEPKKEGKNLGKEEIAEVLKRNQSDRGDTNVERVGGLGIESGRAAMTMMKNKKSDGGVSFQTTDVERENESKTGEDVSTKKAKKSRKKSSKKHKKEKKHRKEKHKKKQKKHKKNSSGSSSSSSDSEESHTKAGTHHMLKKYNKHSAEASHSADSDGDFSIPKRNKKVHSKEDKQLIGIDSSKKRRNIETRKPSHSSKNRKRTSSSSDPSIDEEEKERFKRRKYDAEKGSTNKNSRQCRKSSSSSHTHRKRHDSSSE